MLFKTDENMPPAAADVLQVAGHDVLTVFDQGLRSCADPAVLAVCQAESRILISLDLDFSNILVYPPERYAGLIVLRLHNPSKRTVTSIVRRLLPHLGSLPIAGRLWTVDERRIRIRSVGETELGPV